MAIQIKMEKHLFSWQIFPLKPVQLYFQSAELFIQRQDHARHFPKTYLASFTTTQILDQLQARS